MNLFIYRNMTARNIITVSAVLQKFHSASQIGKVVFWIQSVSVLHPPMPLICAEMLDKKLTYFSLQESVELTEGFVFQSCCTASVISCQLVPLQCEVILLPFLQRGLQFFKSGLISLTLFQILVSHQDTNLPLEVLKESLKRIHVRSRF